MIALARKLRARTAAERRTLAAAVVARLCAAVAVRVVPYGAIRRWSVRIAERRQRAGWPTDAVDRARDARIAWAVRTAAVIMPLRGSCLVDAVAAQWLLAFGGRASTIRFGVAPTVHHRLDAHAWLEVDGDVLIGESAAHHELTP